MSSIPSALMFESVSKRYGAIQALKGIDLDVAAGTVHALVGENGAGKSTCLGITSGRVVPTSGKVRLAGVEAPAGRPREIRNMGVATIYQELTIAPNLTPSQNVFLGQFRSSWGVLASREMRLRYEALALEIGVAVHPEIPAGRLSVADQQVLEILRALASGARTILFDEPTASLARPERSALLALIKRLREDGYTIVFVSHNLDEVLEISDRITVFRDGQTVADVARRDATKHDLVHHMLGDGKAAAMVEDVIEGGGHSARPVSTEEVLRVANVALPGVLSSVSFSVRKGEILGIGGLVGSGRTELLRCIAGLEPASTGRMEISGGSVAWPRSVRAALSHGIVLVPEDRKGQGIIPKLTAAENIGVGNLSRFCSNWNVVPRKLQANTAGPAIAYGFDSRRLTSLAGTLSGGNQQKLLLARASVTNPRVLLADEPTRGIDVGAKAEIMESLRNLASEGCAVVVVSSELEEVVALSDRVVVMNEGHMAGVIDGSEEPLTISGILKMAFGVEEDAAPALRNEAVSRGTA